MQRHAHAEHVWVRLHQGTENVVLEVEDNGTGIPDAPADAPAHFGLRIIRERAENLGGQFRLQSEPGRGTVLRVIVPASRIATLPERS